MHKKGHNPHIYLVIGFIHCHIWNGFGNLVISGSA